MLVGLLGLLTALVNAHRPVGEPSLRESAAVALRMALAGAPIMLALFLFFPRFAPLWGMPSDALTGRSGLSSTMEVGQVAKLALDDGIALRVKFDGAPPPQGELYFRGPVLSRFDGRQWTARGGPGFEGLGLPPPSDLQVQGEPVRYEVTLEPSHRPWLLTLDVAPHAPELPEGRGARLTGDLQWLSPRPVTELLRYRAESYPRFHYGLAGGDGKPRRDLDEYLRLPAGYNPRTLALAEQLRAQVGEGNALALVQVALERLRRGGYVYTLEPGVAGQHTADEFWFDTKAGFCEHISSAFVVLLRAAGVPARIVTGYQGGELNGVDGFWVVRHADAHAWTEVWDARRGWLRVDPTAAVQPARIGQLQRLRRPEGLVAGAIGSFSPTLVAQLRSVWEAVNNGWNQWVLNYTQSRQLELLRQLGFASPELDRPGQGDRRPAGGRRDGRHGLGPVGTQPARPLAAPAGTRAPAPGRRRRRGAAAGATARAGTAGGAQRPAPGPAPAAGRLAAGTGNPALRPVAGCGRPARYTATPTAPPALAAPPHPP
jgi:transglutaminase-like putative cysteine protease